MNSLNVLGTDYKLIVKGYKEEKAFKRRNMFGYCDGYAKEIVVCDPSTYPGMKNDGFETNDAFFRCILRHEIVHAFMFESGLAQNSDSSNAWAMNEEMVDWIARQGIKLNAAWAEAESKLEAWFDTKSGRMTWKEKANET